MHPLINFYNYGLSALSFTLSIRAIASSFVHFVMWTGSALHIGLIDNYVFKENHILLGSKYSFNLVKIVAFAIFEVAFAAFAIPVVSLTVLFISLAFLFAIVFLAI